jgi:predicted O-linked N-acetylglucosamine transferase (SPINDLY family)
MHSDPLSLYLSLAEKRLKVCDWHNRSEYLIALQTYLENVDQISASDADIMLLKAACYAGTEPSLRLELARYIAQEVTKDLETFEYDFPNKLERLRIGYLAKSFNQDSMVRNTAGIYALHNRHEFEVYCYSMEPGDKCKLNQQIRKDCDQFVELYPRSESEAAQKIHDDGIHILVDLDGITQEYPYQLLARQVAPIQAGFAGMPFSSGADFLQYRITDNLVSTAETDDYWSEKLVRLPNTHTVYNQQQIVGRNSTSRKREGLPGGTVYCCFAEAELIDPKVFSCWMKILQRVPGSVLWLIERDEGIRENLRKEAYDFDINPRRLIFAPVIQDQEQHLARYRLADLFLDTFTINACEATSDALWSGLPVLSLFGETMANRMTAGKLSALEFPTLICSTEEEYLERACYLATHPEYLGILKRKVQRNVLTKPLFNTQLTVLNLEKAYREMWDRYFQGEAIESFQIEEE